MSKKNDPLANLGRARAMEKARLARGEKPAPHPMQEIWDADKKMRVEADRQLAQQLAGGRAYTPPAPKSP